MKCRNDRVLEQELGILTTWIKEICDIQLDSVKKKLIRLISDKDQKHQNVSTPQKAPACPSP